MIKPGTVCMIRGVPKDSPAYVANGCIVQVIQYLGDWRHLKNVHEFDPPVVVQGSLYNKAQERWLHPLDDFEDDLNREALDEALQHTFTETIVRELSK